MNPSATTRQAPSFGPENPPRLRKPGETLDAYRTAMGWRSEMPDGHVGVDLGAADVTVIALLARAEDRLTRRAVDEADIELVSQIRVALVQIDPDGAGRRFARG